MNVCPSCSYSSETMKGIRVHYAKSHGGNLPNCMCRDCGIEFYHPESDRKFCNECDSFAKSNNGNWGGGMEVAECVTCGSKFEYYPSDKEGIYCSDCSDNSWGNENLVTRYGRDNPNWNGGTSQLIECECAVCGAAVERKKYILDKRKAVLCSEKCVSTWASNYFSGDNNPMWKGGYHKDWYNNREWKETRRLAKKRDNYQCQNCGSGEMLDVHHIRPVREFDDPIDAHYIENVITLCRSCHRKVEVGGEEIDL